MTKPTKAQGRLGQCNKIFRLRRRELGQWKPQPPQVKASAVTRYTLENEAFREGL